MNGPKKVSDSQKLQNSISTTGPSSEHEMEQETSTSNDYYRSEVSPTDADNTTDSSSYSSTALSSKECVIMGKQINTLGLKIKWKVSVRSRTA